MQSRRPKRQDEVETKESSWENQEESCVKRVCSEIVGWEGYIRQRRRNDKRLQGREAFCISNFVKISDMGRECRRFVATLRFSRVELRYRVDR